MAVDSSRAGKDSRERSSLLRGLSAWFLAPKVRPKIAQGKRRRRRRVALGRGPTRNKPCKGGLKKHRSGRKRQNGEDVTGFHCLFGPSQLRRLGPKGPRNTNMVAVLPRAAHAFSVLALGWYVSRFQRFCRFAAINAASITGCFAEA